MTFCQRRSGKGLNFQFAFNGLDLDAGHAEVRLLAVQSDVDEDARVCRQRADQVVLSAPG